MKMLLGISDLGLFGRIVLKRCGLYIKTGFTILLGDGEK